MNSEQGARDVYQRLIDGWNGHDASAMASAIADDGVVIGFDGSQMRGSEAVGREISRIFADHETASYIAKIRTVRAIGAGIGLLEAVVGMVPPGASHVMPDRNAIQTVVARRDGDRWCAALFQTTPAEFHGRPDLVEALTAELQDLVDRPDSR